MVAYAGWNSLLYKDGELVGYVTTVSFEVTSGLEPLYELGASTPFELQRQRQEITGTIEQIFVDSTMLDLVTGTTTLDDFDLDVYIGDTGNRFRLGGCKLESGSIEVPQDGTVTGSYDFRAKTITKTA